LIYELKFPVKYTSEKTCKAIEFRRPKGKEAGIVFSLVSALMPASSGGEIPADIADKVVAFVSTFGEIVGDAELPSTVVAEQLDTVDIWELVGAISENFM